MATEDRRSFESKVKVFLSTHRRIVDDFSRSLTNARHFLELAEQAKNREPDNTVSMLEQIKEIDLYGHLSRQFDEYQHVAGFLLPPNSPVDDRRQENELHAMTARYEQLLEEAAEQMELIDQLLASLHAQ